MKSLLLAQELDDALARSSFGFPNWIGEPHFLAPEIRNIELI